MFIDVNKLDTGPHSFDERFRLPESATEGIDDVLVGEVHLRGSVERSSRGGELKAKIDAPVTLDCCRCLEPHESPVSSEFSLILVRDAVEYGVGETQLISQDLEIFHATDGKADLALMAAEQVFLNIPLKPVCRVDCQGLCPACGVNRNRLECACPSEALDLRLAPLLEIKKRRSDG
jgi:uncharacterized protein